MFILSIAMRYQLYGNSEINYHLEPAKEEGFPKDSREPRSKKYVNNKDYNVAI